MSRNGDWAVEPTAGRRMDLRSRAEVAVGCEGEVRGVIDDGRVFCSPSEQAVLWSPERTDTFSVGRHTTATAVDPSGEVFAVRIASGVTVLRRARTATMIRFLCQCPDVGFLDHNTWLWLGEWPLPGFGISQVFQVDLVTGVESRRSDLPEGVRFASMSADQSALFVSSGNRLRRLRGDRWEEIVPRTAEALGIAGPGMEDLLTGVVPGSRYWIVGSGLFPGGGDAGSFGYVFRPEVLETRAYLGERALLMDQGGGGGINVQIPFEQELGEYPLRVETGRSQMESALARVRVVDWAPLRVGRSILHQDFTEITGLAPARAGEYLNAHFIGLGAVSPSFSSGTYPYVAEHRVVRPFSCRLGSRDLDVPFVGLAPNIVGVYQVVFRMPDDLPVETETAVLHCEGNEARISVRR